MRVSAELLEEVEVKGILLEAAKFSEIRHATQVLRNFVGPFQLQPGKVKVQGTERVALLLVFEEDARNGGMLVAEYSLALVQCVIEQLNEASEE